MLSKKLDDSWERRKAKAEKWNAELEKGLIKPDFFRRTVWNLRSLAALNQFTKKRVALEKSWRSVEGRKEPSVALALNDTVGLFFWSGGLFKVYINQGTRASH